MNKTLIIAVLWMFSSCGHLGDKSDTTRSDSTVTPNKIGADKDTFGCRRSAGYTWSVVKNSCIRPFETGTAFTHYGTNTDSTQVAYVVLSKDKSTVEVFFALTDKPIVMEAVPIMEGDIAPILFENKTEMLDLIFRKDVYYIRFKNDPKFSQEANILDGFSIRLTN